MPFNAASLTESVSKWLYFLLGFSTFLPIGMSYLFIFCLGLLLATSSSYRQSRTAVPDSWYWLLLLFLLWPVFTMIFNWHDDSFVRWSHSLRLAIVVWLALTMTLPERSRLLQGFLIGATYAIAVALTHEYLITLPEWVGWHQLLSITGNASSQKWIMLAAAIGVVLNFAISSERTEKQKITLSLIALLLVWMVFTFSISRNSYLVAITMPLAVLIYHIRKPRLWPLIAPSALAIGMVIIHLSSQASLRFQLAWNEFHNFIETGDLDGSVNVRTQMLQTAWNTMLEHPIVGAGLGSWQEIWYQVSAHYPEMAKQNNPHNDFLLWGMETGVPGLLLVVALLVRLGRDAWIQNNLPGGIAWCLFWALAITSLVNAPLRDNSLGLSLLLLAVAYSNPKLVPIRKDYIWPRKGTG